jgi:hypothetical protein
MVFIANTIKTDFLTSNFNILPADTFVLYKVV